MLNNFCICLCIHLSLIQQWVLLFTSLSTFLFDLLYIILTPLHSCLTKFNLCLPFIHSFFRFFFFSFLHHSVLISFCYYLFYYIMVLSILLYFSLSIFVQLYSFIVRHSIYLFISQIIIFIFIYFYHFYFLYYYIYLYTFLSIYCSILLSVFHSYSLTKLCIIIPTIPFNMTFPITHIILSIILFPHLHLYLSFPPPYYLSFHSP